MELLDLLVIAITAAAICLGQAWVSLQSAGETQVPRRRGLEQRPRSIDGIPQPANDTWSIGKAA